ncbi:MAG: hypothetical protein ACE5OQ_15060, partial [Woeseia sp.]
RADHNNTVGIGAPEIEYSQTWFDCEAHYECIVVYDAFCKNVAVNSRYSLVYQDWSQWEVTRVRERVVCPGPRVFAGGAGCRNGRCIYPFGLEDYFIEPIEK